MDPRGDRPIKRGWRGSLGALLLGGSLVAMAAREATAEIHDLKGIQKVPKLIKSVQPEYPFYIARAGLIGEVAVVFIIDPKGDVQNPYVVESNNPWFERPAIEAVLKWKFTPGEMNGRVVYVRAQQLIKFELDTGGNVPEIWRVVKGKGQEKLPAQFQWETAPVPARTTYPVYPFDQLKVGTAGKARISYVVGPNGWVVNAKVLEATAPEFGAAVMAMIDGWTFKPAKKKDGTACYAALSSAYEFRPSGRADVPVSDEASAILSDLAKNPGRIVGLKDLDQPLKPLSRRPPVYPGTLDKAGEAGSATIEFFVDKHGDAQLPRIVSCSAPEFGYAAVQAVATWRFDPPKKGGKLVVVRAQIPMDFKKPVVRENNNHEKTP
jgi:TonB family protein